MVNSILKIKGYDIIHLFLFLHLVIDMNHYIHVLKTKSCGNNHLFYYLPLWHHVMIALCFKWLPSNKTSVHCLHIRHDFPMALKDDPCLAVILKLLLLSALDLCLHKFIGKSCTL
jgi:hypothetical protein